MEALLFSIVLLGVLTTTLSQLQPQQPGQGARQCMQDFDKNLSPRCFETVGLNFQGVLFLITQNVTGSLPAGETVMSYKEKVCPRKQIDFIVPCVLQFSFMFANNTCSPSEVEMIQTSGRQLAGMLENMCMEPCARNAIQSANQCLVQAKVNPQRILNTTMTREKFSFIGVTQQETAKFCNVRTKLFGCLKQVMQPCPGAQRTLSELGFDVISMEQAAEFLCSQQEAYVGALQCFAKPSPQVASCQNQTNQILRQILFLRYQNGQVRPSEFIVRLCGLRLNQIDCELRAYRQSCPQVTPMRNQLECTILPTPCKMNPQFRDGLSQLCPDPNRAQSTQPVDQTPRPGVTKPTSQSNGPQPSTGSADFVYSSVALFVVVFIAWLL